MAELQSTIIARVKKEDREYVFLMPQGAPCGEAYDACFEVLQEIIKMSERLAEQAKNVRKEPENNAQQS
ncbi:MAG TPA: hypothetical protein VFM18_00575 [Methanosarcina sp.]|nr:hypothetical protein [Methanosarcina sp.]